jgi:hypothetical protein
MPVALSVKVEGVKELQARLDRIDPKKNSAWVARALMKCALRVQEVAAKEKILPGGKGPPVKGILTSRTGTLRRSIGVNRSPLPWAVEVGTDLIYGAVHETSKKFPRPFLKPSLDDVADEMDDIFARELAKELP